tara:strand:+ start:16297 stop:16830 length:534 start_codon:yes stop_codon:yes gene_type:complete
MKKRLLNEDVTRRFMKLANIGTLAESYLDETMYEEEEELGMEEPPAEEEDLEGVPEEEPLEVPEEGGDIDVESLVSAIAQAIEAETGVEVAVEGGAEEEMPLEEPPIEEEPPVEGELEEEPPVEGGEEELMQEDDIDEDPAAADATLEEDALDEDDIVNEITRRVARRLLRASATRR